MLVLKTFMGLLEKVMNRLEKLTNPLVVSKAFNAGMDAWLTPKSFSTGETFEAYVQKVLFVEAYYELLHRTRDYPTNHKRFVKSSLYPDFKFRDRCTKKEFYVEVKFRARDYNGKIEGCNPDQLRRHQEIHKKIPVFIALGIGGKPNHPEYILLLPLNEARYTGLYISLVHKFQIAPDKPVLSRILWNR